MIRTILWFIYFWLYLIAIWPKLLKAKSLKNQKRQAEHDQLVHRTAQKWARSLLSFAGVNVFVHGLENIPQDETVVFVSNHQGNFDIPILLGYIDRPKAFVAKVELLKMPLIRTWMTHMRCVFMDRSDVRQSLKTIQTAADYVKEGTSMVIFPEGTRSKGPAVGEFKPGSFKLAFKSQATIIPVTIRGSYKIMEETGFVIKPAQVDVYISEPILTRNISKEDALHLPDQVKEIIQNKAI